MKTKYLVIVLMVFATIALLFVACTHEKKEGSKDSDTYYTCSMHPQVNESHPGHCPICHMDLIAVKKGQQQMTTEVQLSPSQIQLGNIKTDTLSEGTGNNQQVLTGTLTYDQTTASAVSARVSGRVDKLYYKALGEFVPAGAKLYDLYSEELNDAKEQYRNLLEKERTLGNTMVDYKQLIQAAKNKLELWGLSENQIHDIDQSKQSNILTSFYSKESGYITEINIMQGDYLSEGTTVIRLSNLSSLWVEAQAYTSQLPRIEKGTKAIVNIPDLSDKTINGNITFVNPEIDPTTRINLIRVSIPNGDHKLQPGMAAYVTIQSPSRKGIFLPINAVLRNGKMASVWVQIAPDKFKSKMVTIGEEGNGLIEVLSGVEKGEVIVISGAYLLQSEYVFRNGSDPMAGMNMNMNMGSMK
ncbi:efflux RND transporter periplasmic adaptor subunit [Flavobacterium aquidurense]|uniref:Cu(I)/Ag(I) efflux system membrane fusion protein n=2 Tax=Flavobacterium TaxID=237 RepID=A0A7W7IWI1_9FLAO|nr:MULTISPECIES: efflux RND transporter periplasmic adaptor subunit [Flavobacterium]MBB4801730.1 Cu(I)/Ag(I) efflux system membrane fusion protein [Flavobacterium nitrogenifigens]MBB6386688.1 Cu(I)/Ag(I) efflux system membrane fusion protein [Flavobacterium notoginsengisoli]